MKNTLLIVNLGLFLLPLHRAHAQTPAKQQPFSVPRSATPPSWVFLLETKTQWLLVLQENRGVPGDIISNKELGSPDYSGNVQNPSGNRSPSGSAQGRSGNTSGPNQAVSKAVKKEAEAGSGDPTVFEGNTNYIPLEEPPHPSLGMLPSSRARPVIFLWKH